ncbi:hypothetical protein E2C01_074429 [Portunus trituberculatus]|uniref:Uncharacterized protein n=1 Tax=Portunus trituberculatus TaxID=210409 RepID=A0A5B7ID53_PORTR|nr:hypothetical protein [Portunus trituberculatus]
MKRNATLNAERLSTLRVNLCKDRREDLSCTEERRESQEGCGAQVLRLTLDLSLPGARHVDWPLCHSGAPCSTQHGSGSKMDCLHNND